MQVQGPAASFRKLGGRKYCIRVPPDHSQAEPPKIDSQLLGGDPSGLASAQTRYQSALGDFRAGLAFVEPWVLVRVCGSARGSIRTFSPVSLAARPDPQPAGPKSPRLTVNIRVNVTGNRSTFIPPKSSMGERKNGLIQIAVHAQLRPHAAGDG